MEVFELVRLALAIAMFSFGAYYDWKTGMISEKLWLVFAIMVIGHSSIRTRSSYIWHCMDNRTSEQLFCLQEGLQLLHQELVLYQANFSMRLEWCSQSYCFFSKNKRSYFPNVFLRKIFMNPFCARVEIVFVRYFDE